MSHDIVGMWVKARHRFMKILIHGGIIFAGITYQSFFALKD